MAKKRAKKLAPKEKGYEEMPGEMMPGMMKGKKPIMQKGSKPMHKM